MEHADRTSMGRVVIQNMFLTSMANGSHVFCSVVHCGCNYKHNQMDNKVVYVLKARPESITKQMQQD